MWHRAVDTVTVPTSTATTATIVATHTYTFFLASTPAPSTLPRAQSGPRAVRVGLQVAGLFRIPSLDDLSAPAAVVTSHVEAALSLRFVVEVRRSVTLALEADVVAVKVRGSCSCCLCCPA